MDVDGLLTILGIFIGIFGVLVTVYFSVSAYQKKKKVQKQKMGDNSFGVQSGRDTNIGG